MSETSQNKEKAASGPNKLLATVCGLCVCGTVGLFAGFFAPHAEPLRRLWLPVMVQTNGTETILGDTRQLECWTPSVRTREYLHRENGEVVAPEKWEVFSNDDAVIQFGALLHSNKSILGYRRFEVWGQGSTGFKPGWWWTVNVFTNYSVADFAKVYNDYWHSAHPVFVEVIDDRGSGDAGK